MSGAVSEPGLTDSGSCQHKHANTTIVSTDWSVIVKLRKITLKYRIQLDLNFIMYTIAESGNGNLQATRGLKYRCRLCARLMRFNITLEFQCRGVASFTQIRTCVLGKSVGFLKDFVRTPSSIPFWVQGLISTLSLFSQKLPLCSSLPKTLQMGKINS